MLDMENETCKIAMSYEIIDFRNIVVKPFFKNEAENVTDVKNENIDHIDDKEKVEKTFFSNSPSTFKRGRDRPKKLPLRYKNFETDISIFLQNDFQNDQLLMQHMQAPTPVPNPFVESRKEINDLFEKNCFEVVSTSDVSHGVRIFNSRFVDEIKNIDTVDAYEKSRLVMQTYNDQGKAEVLTQTSTIQRMSQRFILTLVVNMSHLSFFLRDISQVYVQSIISLARQFFIKPPIELGFGEGTILKIIKFLYGVSKAGIHWFNTYHKHHTEKLVMQQSIYDSCFLYINKKGKGFEVVELQIDDTLILGDETFAKIENFHFHEVKLLAKNRDQLIFQHSIKFNGVYIKQENLSKQKNSFYLNQERLCKNLRLITF